MEAFPSSNGEDPPDNECGKRARRAPREPFSKFAEKYQRRIFGLILRRLKHDHDSWDLTQETLKKTWLHFPDFDTNKDPWPLICEIAMNNIRDFARRKKTLKRGAKTVMLTDVIDLQDDPPKQMARDERRALLRRAMEGLGDEDRSLLKDFYFDGNTLQQIAEDRGLSKSAANSRLHRARGKLRNMLETNRAFRTDYNFHSSIEGGIS